MKFRALALRLSWMAVVHLPFASCSNQDGGVNCSVRVFGDTSELPASSLKISRVAGSGGPLERNQYKTFASKAFASKGCRVIDSRAAWDVAMTYSIGNGRENIYSRAIPVFGQTGYSSSSTSGTITPSYLGAYNYSSTTRMTPSYGITGYANKVESEVVFPRYLCFEGRKQGSNAAAWKIEVFSDGGTSDMNALIPFLSRAAVEMIGAPAGTSDQLTILPSAVDKMLSGQN